MPRGVKRVVDYTNELQELTNKISRHQDQIAQLEKRRNEVLEQKRQADVARLVSFLDQKGYTVDAAMELLQTSSVTI